MTIKAVTNVLTWKELSDMFGVKSPEDEMDRVCDVLFDSNYEWARGEAKRQLGEDATEDELDLKCDEIEQDSRDSELEDHMSKYRSAIQTVAENMFGEHHLCLTEVEEEGKLSHFLVEPKKNSRTGWYRAASEIITTINGVGMFGFSTVRELIESGPYESVRDAVLQHLHWIPSYSEVYEGTKSKYLIDRRMK